MIKEWLETGLDDWLRHRMMKPKESPDASTCGRAMLRGRAVPNTVANVKEQEPPR